MAHVHYILKRKQVGYILTWHQEMEQKKQEKSQQTKEKVHPRQRSNTQAKQLNSEIKNLVEPRWHY